MNERLKKIREKDPTFDRRFIDKFDEKMPELLEIMLDGELYNNHIGEKKTARLAQQFITNDKGEYIGFRWDFESVMNIAKSYTDLNNSEFYPEDLWVWANVKYGDMGHLINEPSLIIRYAISELEDEDYPFEEPSQRAYCWLRKHLENK